MEGFVQRIPQYDGKEQAELRVRVKIPGSWFDNLTAAEREQKYEAEAYEYVPTHRFPRSRHRAQMNCAALKFLCQSDVFEDPQHAGFIIPVTEWNRYRHDTYKDNPDAEKIYIRTVAHVEAPKAPAKEPSRPPIYEQFDFVQAGKHTVKSRDGSTKEVACEWWRCKNTSGKCKHRVPFKVVLKATGKMLDHLKICNPSAYVPIALASKGSSGEVDEDGNVVKMLPFKDQLHDHARFVIMIVLEWDHFNKCRSPSRKAYVKGLKRGASTPHRNTCIKLLMVIKQLMAGKLEAALLGVLNELGPQAIGAQDDIWSVKNCRESYGCLRTSAIIKIKGVLHDVNPLLAFRTFSSSSHTGMVIKVWKESTLQAWKLHAVKSISLWTEDGAANNIKSSKLLGVPYEVCGPHQVQRANLFGLGMAGAQSKNPEAKAFVGRMSKQSSSFHSSGVASKGLQAAQIMRGVSASKVKSTEVANATRWTGIFRCAAKTRLLEPDIKIGLTGEADGVTLETPADIDLTSIADEKSDEEGSEKGEEEVDSDAEQVAANEAAGKKFPLSHRCLSSIEFKHANQLESVLLPSHETVTLMQKGSGIDPGTSHLLAIGCVSLTKSPKLLVVSGSEGKEVWKEVHEASLEKMFRKYRTVFTEQMTKRFSMSSHPGVHVLRCWKMNPSVDTTKGGALFKNKPSVFELMEGEYLHRLRLRFQHAFGGASEATPALPLALTATAPATAPAAAPATAPATAPAAAPAAAPAPAPAVATPPAPSGGGYAGGKRKLSILSAVQEFQTSAAANTTAVEDKIQSEISKFESLKLTVDKQQYESGGFFDMLAFYNDHQAILPIHTLVYRADVGSMKGASACVESVFSGVKRLLGDFAATMSPEILEMYVFVHYNWQYEFMRPTIQEIVDAYLQIYGAEPREEDVAEDSDDEKEEDGEDDDEGDKGGE